MLYDGVSQTAAGELRPAYRAAVKGGEILTPAGFESARVRPGDLRKGRGGNAVVAVHRCVANVEKL